MKHTASLLGKCGIALLLITLLVSCGHSRSLISSVPSASGGSGPSASSLADGAYGDYSLAGEANSTGLPADARYKGPYRLPEGRIVYTQETIDEYPLLKEAGIQPGIYQMDEPVAGKSSSTVNIDHEGMIAPSTGNVKALVLKVQYASTAGNHHWTNTQINHRLFEPDSDIDIEGSLHDFYERQSYNQLHIDGDIYPTDEDTYYQVSGSPQIFGNMLKLTRTQWLDLMNQADADLNFNNYDSDGDHNVDCVYLLFRKFTGVEIREYVGFPGIGVTWYQSDFNYDNVKVMRVVVLDDSAIEPNVFVAFHETGHVLGLPDYYDYGGDYSERDNPGPDGDESNGCGFWELMAAGNYVYPCQGLSALNRYILGWDTPINVTTNMHDVHIPPRESGMGHIYRLWKNGVEGPEYFLIENRGTNGEWIVSHFNSSYYPSKVYLQLMPLDLRKVPPGLLIWHVDENVYNGLVSDQDVGKWGYGCNDYEEHKFLDLEESGATYSINYDSWETIVDHRDYGTNKSYSCLLYTSPSPRDLSTSRMPSSA